MKKYETKLFIDFMESINKKRKKQNEKKSFYWPKLNTLSNGYIDWSWNAKDIVLFCKAFSEPFDGASTFIGNNRIHFLDVELVDNNIKFHPFQSGLIYRIVRGSYYVATNKGAIRINKYTIKDKINDSKFKLGQRFITPYKKLYSALTTKKWLLHS
jgi:methionyl-tRNA formyltransferase